MRYSTSQSRILEQSSCEASTHTILPCVSYMYFPALDQFLKLCSQNTSNRRLSGVSCCIAPSRCGQYIHVHVYMLKERLKIAKLSLHGTCTCTHACDEEGPLGRPRAWQEATASYLICRVRVQTRQTCWPLGCPLFSFSGSMFSSAHQWRMPLTASVHAEMAVHGPEASTGSLPSVGYQHAVSW